MSSLKYLSLWLILALIPLLTTTGRNLEYEYSLLLSLGAVLAMPPVHLWLPASWKPSSKPLVRLPLYFVAIPLCMLTPGLLMFALGVCPCGFREFLFWFCVQATPAVIFAGGFCHFLEVLAVRMRGRKNPVKLWFLLLTMGMSELVWLLWSYPQKRITHWLAGFLHGPVYDDLIFTDWGVLLLRMSHLVLGLFLLSIPWPKSPQKLSLVRISPSLCLAGLWLVLKISASPFPSTGHGEASLGKHFDQSYNSELFSLYTRGVDPESRRLKRLLAETEFHIKELKGLLGLTRAPKPGIYVYPDEASKKLWFGAGSTDVTDVYSPTIHITMSDFPHPTLRHELVHALSSDIAWGGLGFHPDMALTEGLAVALAPEFRSLSLDEGAASMLKSGRIQNLEKLLSPFFWMESGTRAYTTAGSLVGFFLETFGPDSLKNYYSGMTAEDAFGTPGPNLLKRWKEHIFSTYDEEKSGLFAEALFRSPGLLFSRCPHSKALYRAGNLSSPDSVRLPEGWVAKNDYWPWFRGLQAEEKWVKVEDLKKQAEKSVRGKESPAIQDLMQAVKVLRVFPPYDLEDVELGLLLSDLLRLTDTVGSLAILSGLAKAAEKRHPGPNLWRQIHIRIVAEVVFSPGKAQSWRLYLAGWEKIPPPEPDSQWSWVETYLRLRNPVGWASLKEKKVLETLLQNPPDQPLYAPFKEQWFYYTGKKALTEGYPDLAEEAFQRAAGESPPGKRLRYLEYSRLAKFTGEKDYETP